MRGRLSREAQVDLGNITDYLIANSSRKTARRISQGLRLAAQEVGRSPKTNVVIATYLGRPLHRKPFMRWAILYYEAGEEVVIARIADGSQDYLAWFEKP